MNTEICVLAPDATVAEQVMALQPSMCLLYSVVRCTVDDCVSIARPLVEKGVRVVVARGSQAARLRESGLEIAVIEIPIAGYDLIETMKKARRYDSRVALVGFDNVLEGAEKIARALDMELFTSRVYSMADSARGVDKAFEAGFRVIIGGLRVTERAQSLGMKALPLNANMENVRKALAEAERMALVLRTQRESEARLAVTFNAIRDAIITFDTGGNVIFFNRQADTHFDLSSRTGAGGFVAASGLGAAIRAEVDWNGEVVSWKGKHYACTVNPVVSDMRIAGRVAVLQTDSHVQSMEHKMRHTLHNRGHVALYRLEDIVHGSSMTENLIETARFFAQSPSTVLIEGESGTGKELFAQGIHNASARKAGPFVAVNCAAIPSSLMESEIFGYAEGAFTGARRGGKPGLFELAHQGTLFMDEIGDMPLGAQSSLLRVLEERTVMRVGQGTNIPVDVRVICAVNRDMFQMTRGGSFRSNLYYRLNVLRLFIPPLRERPEDVAALVEHFLTTLPLSLGRPRPVIEPEGMRLLLGYAYPGNVRELRNIVERLIVTSHDGVVAASEVASHLRAVTPAPSASRRGASENIPATQPRGLLAREAETLIRRTLQETGNNKAETARRLGISQATLWRRLRKNT